MLTSQASHAALICAPVFRSYGMSRALNPRMFPSCDAEAKQNGHGEMLDCQEGNPTEVTNSAQSALICVHIARKPRAVPAFAALAESSGRHAPWSCLDSGYNPDNMTRHDHDRTRHMGFKLQSPRQPQLHISDLRRTKQRWRVEDFKK